MERSGTVPLRRSFRNPVPILPHRRSRPPIHRHHFVIADRGHGHLEPLPVAPGRGHRCADQQTHPRTVAPAGNRTRTRGSPTAINSRIGLFIVIGFVGFTSWTVGECFCRHPATSSTPGPVTVTGAASFVAHATALRRNFRDRHRAPPKTSGRCPRENTRRVPRRLRAGKPAARPSAASPRIPSPAANRDTTGCAWAAARKISPSPSPRRAIRRGSCAARPRVPPTTDSPLPSRVRAADTRCASVPGFPRKTHAEQPGEPEVLSLHAPRVVKRRLRSRHDPAATLDERPQLRALRVGQRHDIRQNQRLERREVLRVEAPVCASSQTARTPRRAPDTSRPPRRPSSPARRRRRETTSIGASERLLPARAAARAADTAGSPRSTCRVPPRASASADR